MVPWVVWLEGGFGSYRWFVYITTLLLREASWLLYCIVGHPASAIYIVSSGVRFGEAFGPTEKWWQGTCFWSCVKTILVMTKTAISYEYSNIVIFRLTNIYNVYIYLTCKEENILTFKTVNFLSFHFKIICLLSPPSWTRAEILGCSLVQPNV